MCRLIRIRINQNCSDGARASLAIDALSTDLYSYALARDLHRDSQSAVTV